MTSRALRVASLIVLVTLSSPVVAQVSEGGTPISISKDAYNWEIQNDDLESFDIPEMMAEQMTGRCHLVYCIGSRRPCVLCMLITKGWVWNSSNHFKLLACPAYSVSARGIKQLAEFNVLTHKVKHCAAQMPCRYYSGSARAMCCIVGPGRVC